MAMAMDVSALGEIAGAISTIYDPSSTNEQRQLAQNFCDSLKDNPLSPMWGRQLAHKDSNQPDIIRHFGLSLIENAVRYKWNDGSYSNQDRAQLRDSVVDLMKNGLYDIGTERTFVKEKVARIFVEIAKRMWPLQWTDMDVLLREFYATSANTQELVLMICRSLAEDIFLYDDVVASLRKKELVTGMLAVTVSADTLEKFHAKRGSNVILTDNEPVQSDYELLLRIVRANPANEGWLIRWSRAVTELDAQRTSHAQAGVGDQAALVKRLEVATLNTLVVYLDWVIPDAISESRIAYLVLDLVLSESLAIRQMAIESLVVLFSRQLDPADMERRAQCIWNPVFVDGNIEKLIVAWARAHGQSGVDGIDQVEQAAQLDEEAYKFVKRSAQAAVALGEMHICIKKSPTTPPLFERYLEFLLVIFDHPSILVASMAASLWNDFLKNEYFRTVPEVVAMFPRLLEIVGARMCNIKGGSYNAAESYYYEVDFDSKDERGTFLGGLNTRMCEMCKLIARLMPEDSFHWIGKRIRETLAIQPDPAFQNEIGFQNPKSPYVDVFSGNCTLLELIVIGSKLPKSREEKSSELGESLIAAMMNLVELIVDFETRDPSLVRLQLRMAVAFAEELHAAPDLLLRCLRKIFTFITFTTPADENFLINDTSMREETRILRRTACTSLVRLAYAMPDVLLDFYGELQPAVQQLLQQNKILRSEQTFLTEFLITIIFYARIPQSEKGPALRSLVEPTLREMQEKTEAIVVTPTALIDFVGLPLVMENARDLQISTAQLQVSRPALHEVLMQKRRERGLYLGLMGAVVTYIKRTVLPKTPQPSDDPILLWADHLPVILDCTLANIQTVHGLWNRSLWQGMAPEIVAVLDSTAHEKVLQSNIEGWADAKVGRTQNELKNQVTLISRWLGTLRETHYSTLGRLTFLGSHFYTMPSLGQRLLQTLFAGAAYMDNRHWKTFIPTVMKPLVINCPAGFDGAVLEPILSFFFDFFNSKLDTEWKALTERGIRLDKSEDDSGEDESELTNDIMAERHLRDATRAYVDFVASILTPKPQSGKKAEKTEQKADPLQQAFLYPDLVRFLFWDQSVARLFLMALTRLITCKDTAASYKAAVTCERQLVPLMVFHPEFHAWLGMDLLRALLEALHDGYLQSIHSHIIGAIADLYTKLRPVSTLPYETFAALPGMNLGPLKVFEDKLVAISSPKEQNALVRNFLQTIIGLAVSQLGKKQASFILNVPEKQLMTRPPREAKEEDNWLEGVDLFESENVFDQGR